MQLKELLPQSESIHPNTCSNPGICLKRPTCDAEKVYFALVAEMDNILKSRGKIFELNNANRYIIGQIALWYANDIRFDGDLNKGLLIRGTCGTGKTLSVQALNRIIYLGQKMHAGFVYSVDLQRFYANQDIESIESLKKRTYTIIDDLGVERVEAKYFGNVQEPFNDLFDYRYRNELLSIITTNLMPSEIEDRYGIRILDRFKETLNDLVLDYDSFRK